MPDDKTQILYNALGKDYELGTPDEFRAKLQDPNKRKIFYDHFSNDFDLGDFNSFSQKVVSQPQANNGVTAFDRYTPGGYPKQRAPFDWTGALQNLRAPYSRLFALSPLQNDVASKIIAPILDAPFRAGEGAVQGEQTYQQALKEKDPLTAGTKALTGIAQMGFAPALALTPTGVGFVGGQGALQNISPKTAEYVNKNLAPFSSLLNPKSERGKSLAELGDIAYQIAVFSGVQEGLANRIKTKIGNGVDLNQGEKNVLTQVATPEAIQKATQTPVEPQQDLSKNFEAQPPPKEEPVQQTSVETQPPPDYAQLAKDAGVTFNGIQKGFGNIKDMPLFTDPQSGRTFTPHEGETIDQAKARINQGFTPPQEQQVESEPPPPPPKSGNTSAITRLLSEGKSDDEIKTALNVGQGEIDKATAQFNADRLAKNGFPPDMVKHVTGVEPTIKEEIDRNEGGHIKIPVDSQDKLISLLDRNYGIRDFSVSNTSFGTRKVVDESSGQPIGEWDDAEGQFYLSKDFARRNISKQPIRGTPTTEEQSSEISADYTPLTDEQKKSMQDEYTALLKKIYKADGRTLKVKADPKDIARAEELRSIAKRENDFSKSQKEKANIDAGTKILNENGFNAGDQVSLNYYGSPIEGTLRVDRDGQVLIDQSAFRPTPDFFKQLKKVESSQPPPQGTGGAQPTGEGTLKATVFPGASQIYDNYIRPTIENFTGKESLGEKLKRLGAFDESKFKYTDPKEISFGDEPIEGKKKVQNAVETIKEVKSAQVVRGNQLANQMRDLLNVAKKRLGYNEENALTFYNAAKGNIDQLNEWLSGNEPELEPYRKDIERATHLSPEALQAYKMMREYYDESGQVALKLGTIKNVIDNYGNRIWDIENKRPTEVGKGGISSYTRHRKERVFADEVEGILSGMKPKTLSAPDLLAIHNEEMANANTNAKVVDAFRKSGDGHFYNAGSVPEGLKVVPGLDRYIPIDTPDGKGAVLHKQFAVPEPLADAVKVFTDPNQFAKSKGFKIFQDYQNKVKSVNVIWSLFHHFNLIKKAVYSTTGGLDILRNFPETYKIFNDNPYRNEMERYWADNGMNTTTLEDNQDILSKLSTGDDFLSKVKDVPGIKQAVSATEANQKFLFDGMQKSYKIMDASLRLSHYLAKHPDATPDMVKEQARGIAKFENSLQGGLNWEAMGVTKTGRAVMRAALFAPDWTVSKVKMFQAALTKGGAEGSAARGYIVKSLIGGYFITQALNKLTTGHGTDQNPKGHEFQWQVRPNTYVSLYPAEVEDALKLSYDTITRNPQGYAAFLQGKLSPALRGAGSLIFNTDYRGEPIVNRKDKLGKQIEDFGVKGLSELLPVPFGASAELKYLYDKGLKDPTAAGLIGLGLARDASSTGDYKAQYARKRYGIRP